MKPVKPVSRVASIMMGAIAFTPVYTIPAMASDDISLAPQTWTVVYPPEGGCYELYDYAGAGAYVADNAAAEWNNFLGTVGNGLNAVTYTGCPPPPPVYYGYYGGYYGGGDGGVE